MNVQQGAEGNGHSTYPYTSAEAIETLGVGTFLTPYAEALSEIEQRAGDATLRVAVETYLNNDMPECFKEKHPVLYLARHVASPNFETLRFLHILEPLDLDIVISQDLSDRFVGTNVLKNALGKMPVCTRVVEKEGVFSELYENVTIIDFNAEQGKPFRDIKTLWGEPLATFHNELFSSFTTSKVHITDDSTWIDRHNRGNLLEHYKKFLALFLVHGILFEDYLIEDKDEEYFKAEVLGPAFAFVEETFGYRPLIVQLTPTSVESPKFWMSYPRRALDIINTRKS